MKIRRNFWRSEFVCHCGCGACEMTDDTLDALQKLRDRVGVPITVTSGFRCHKHNSSKRVKGHPRSRHMTGEAVDIHIHGMDVREMYCEAVLIPEWIKGGIGVYPQSGFIHLDKGRQSRWGVLDGEQTSLSNALGWLDKKTKAEKSAQEVSNVVDSKPVDVPAGSGD